MFGKIENNKLIFATDSITKEGKRIFNPSAEILLELGYKPITQTEYSHDGKHYKQGYEETETEIKVIWVDNEAEYWLNIPYNEAVEAEIAKEYTIGQELAIQRQKEEKPEEYATYYAYCEHCKAYVKMMKKQTENM